MTSDYYKKGAQVIYNERICDYYGNTGFSIKPQQCVIEEQPRDEQGRFTNDFQYESYITVKLRDKNGKLIVTTLDKVEPNRDPSELTFDELENLWKEIRRGSIYTSDYRNFQGVYEGIACDCYEGFWASLVDEYKEETEAEKHDTPEEFADYCIGIGCMRETINLH